MFLSVHTHVVGVGLSAEARTVNLGLAGSAPVASKPDAGLRAEGFLRYNGS